MQIRDVKLSDSKAITDIYNYYILNTIITFEEDPITPEIIEKRIGKVTKKYPWIVLEDEGRIVGYAYGSQFRERYAYRFTTETTVYLDHSLTGKGYGVKLYIELLKQLKQLDYNMALGVISLPNDPSVKLHEKLGFVKAGHLDQSGFKFNKWIDVGFWQLDLKSI
jgi:phosphinothricin acetyltransferase